jgi:catechol 2,3-dioxygenase-like lactoylglutathione lyase family enzyme
LAVFVADMEASVAFYRRAFGFREVYRFAGLHSSVGHWRQIGGRWLELGQSGFYLEVFPLSRRPGSDRPRTIWRCESMMRRARMRPL